MSDDLIIVLGFAIIAIILIFVAVRYFRRRAMRWTGIVIDKNYIENIITRRGNGSVVKAGSFEIDMNPQTQVKKNYYIVVKTDAGQELRWDISEGLYPIINIGDRLSKEPGTMIPMITESAKPQ